MKINNHIFALANAVLYNKKFFSGGLRVSCMRAKTDKQQ